MLLKIDGEKFEDFKRCDGEMTFSIPCMNDIQAQMV